MGIYFPVLRLCPGQASCGGRKVLKKGWRSQQLADCKVGKSPVLVAFTEQGLAPKFSDGSISKTKIS